VSSRSMRSPPITAFAVSTLSNWPRLNASRASTVDLPSSVMAFYGYAQLTAQRKEILEVKHSYI